MRKWTSSTPEDIKGESSWIDTFNIILDENNIECYMLKKFTNKKWEDIGLFPTDQLEEEVGRWWIRSKMDPMWNKSGCGSGLVCMGGPSEIDKWIEKCKETYGDPPNDCEKIFMKYS